MAQVLHRNYVVCVFYANGMGTIIWFLLYSQLAQSK